ncbi:helix-turn-helix domain-containing protein [Plantactinospora veratri]|uniref:Helix-turn-helix domain-containing protein n=1 Tax=Plantactinospora veratri TaxID=1436122 RepID=A0ABU7SLV7_9ACTN
MITIDDIDYLTPNEAAERLGVTPATMRNWRSDGRSPVPYRKLLGKILYPLAEVERVARERGR